jgi:photosystem II stability/assembly factor-like uncharacterized protein
MFLRRLWSSRRLAAGGLVVAVALGILGIRWARAAFRQPEPVQALAVARNGTVWIGTRTGLYQAGKGGGRIRTAFPGGVRQLLIDPGNQAVMYALAEAGPLYQSHDEGEHWQPTAGGGLPGAEIRTVAYDPSGPTRLVAVVAGHGYYQSENSGRSWRRFGPQDVPGATALAINPLEPRAVLVGTPEGLVTSTNQGVRFQRAEPVYPWHLKGGVSSLTVSADRSTMLAATTGGLFRTRDGGRSWSPLAASGLENLSAVGIDPWRPHIIAAGSSQGKVAVSRDGGTTWTYIQ